MYVFVSILKYVIFFVSADTWPEVFDDSNARRDWGWKHKYDIKGLCEIMFEKLKPVYQETKQKAAIWLGKITTSLKIVYLGHHISSCSKTYISVDKRWNWKLNENYF